jgi:GNAT superfamily N-acetyltransferase
MRPFIRIGNINDLETVIHEDQHIKSEILEWKLKNKEIILAVLDEKIIGYLRLDFLWSKYPYIGLIIVNPEYRKQGIGRTMLKYLEELLSDTGHGVLYSSSQVNESYHRNGIEEWDLKNAE